MLEIALIIIALLGYALWFREWRKRRAFAKVVQVATLAAANTVKSSFARREARQIVGVKDGITKLVKSLEALTVPNEKKRETVLKSCGLKMPGIGVGVIDTAIKEALKEIRA